MEEPVISSYELNESFSPERPHPPVMLKYINIFWKPKNTVPKQAAFPSGSDSDESACNAQDLGSIPGQGKSGEGNVSPLQYSCLENSMDRGACCSSKVKPLLLTLDKGYLLPAPPPDLEHGILCDSFFPALAAEIFPGFLEAQASLLKNTVKGGKPWEVTWDTLEKDEAANNSRNGLVMKATHRKRRQGFISSECRTRKRNRLACSCSCQCMVYFPCRCVAFSRSVMSDSVPYGL
ncbi:hypothetical protein MG293_000235 [Ovis ammon polii]|uniref:Uncharacterized protein n=1 Tax=Ovis ammon polii TaxID=230172 RepID=A0AAD4UPI8_OVIAM|nr:hypothetical protein MG293_000235 [Ovis ammon polii]